MAKNEIDPRRIEYLPLAEITPDERNPKDHDTETIDSSIGRFGMLDLIVRDERTGRIVSGHGRRKVLAAMAERGEAPPEGIKTDADGEWLVPVITGWSSRTDSEAAAALIAMNRTTELGGWVDDSLLALLEDLEEVDDGLAGVGFTQADIDALSHLTYEASEDTPMRDLDDLYDEVGDPLPEDALVRVVLHLSPEVAQRFTEALDAGESADEVISGLLGEERS